MNNKPIAWMNEADWMGGIELDVITDEFKQSGKGGDCSEYSIPLYIHPVKEQDESFDRTASHMAGEYVSYKPKLTDEEIIECMCFVDAVDLDGAWEITGLMDFARAILRKAQDK